MAATPAVPWHPSRARRRGALLAASALVAVAPALAGPRGNPLHHPQPEAQPDEFYVVIEIPAGSNVKYEVDAATGNVMVDRFVAMPMVYPANYGSVTSSLQEDGDPLDALVYTRTPLHPGVLIRVRPIGVLIMFDRDERDDKIVSVPVSTVDASFDPIETLEDVSPLERERLNAFFVRYKDLSSARIEVKGYEGRDVARRLVREAVDRFAERHRPAGR